MGTRCRRKPPASVLFDAGDIEVEGLGPPAGCAEPDAADDPCNDELDPTEPGEAACGPQGALGGADGKVLKLVDGEVDTLAGELPISEETDSDRP